MSNLIADYQATYRIDGGPGSGNFGHSGRPGQVGGSGDGDGKQQSIKIGRKTISIGDTIKVTGNERMPSMKFTGKVVKIDRDSWGDTYIGYELPDDYNTYRLLPKTIKSISVVKPKQPKTEPKSKKSDNSFDDKDVVKIKPEWCDGETDRKSFWTVMNTNHERKTCDIGLIDPKHERPFGHVQHVSFDMITHADGGDGSGDWGHAGRPGMVGGSAGKGRSSRTGKATTKNTGSTATDSEKKLHGFLDSREFANEYRNAEADATAFENDNYHYFGNDKRKMMQAADNFEAVVGKARSEVKGFYDSVPVGSIIKIQDPYADGRWDRSVYAAKFPDGRFAMNKDLEYMKSAIDDYNKHGVSLEGWMKDSNHCANETMKTSFEYDRGLDRPNFARDRRPKVVDTVKIGGKKKKRKTSYEFEEEF